MAPRLCANNYNSSIIISGFENRILVPPLIFPSSFVKLQRNPSLSRKPQLLHRPSHHHNHDNSGSSSNRRKFIVPTMSSSSASDVITVEENSSSLITSTGVSSSWLEFVKNVSGEWDGYGADFSVEGEPVELPESVVPEAYREWEVKVFDWQTQCPTLARIEDYTLFYKLIKLLPTVGCEADAATRYSVDERRIGGADNLASAFAYNSSGCYVAVWPLQDHSTYRLLELEHCLVDPHNRESRVRTVQVVRIEKNKFILLNVKVFCEQWYGPFRNGEQLGGCAIRDSAFACTDVLKGSEVTGVWQGLHTVACFSNSQTTFHQELLDDNVQKSVRDEHDLVLLPKQLWCSLKERDNGETCCEVGWLLEQGCAITSKCIFSRDTELKEIAIAREAAAMA